MSGTKLERPELNRLIEESAPGDILLVESMDRLSRLTADNWEELKSLLSKNKVMIVVVDMPSTHILMSGSFDNRIMEIFNNMFFDLYAEFAYRDWERRRERAKQGIKKANIEGKYKGRAKDETKYSLLIQLFSQGHTIEKVANLVGYSSRHCQSLKSKYQTQINEVKNNYWYCLKTGISLVKSITIRKCTMKSNYPFVLLRNILLFFMLSCGLSVSSAKEKIQKQAEKAYSEEIQLKELVNKKLINEDEKTTTFFNDYVPIDVYYDKRMEDILSLIRNPESQVIRYGLKKQISPSSEITSIINKINKKQEYPLKYFWQYTYLKEMYDICLIQQDNAICIMKPMMQHLKQRKHFKDGKQRIVSLQEINKKTYTYIGKAEYNKLHDFLDRIYKQEI